MEWVLRPCERPMLRTFLLRGANVAMVFGGLDGPVVM
jgi:hypothetical protein